MANKKKILLVEDDAFVTDIYRTKLTQEGFEILHAEHGLAAMNELEKSIPDLILLDITMPYMDGLEFLHKMKEKEEYKKIPVIMLTNLSERERIEESLEMGASDYLIKAHFTPSEVVSKVNALFAKLGL